VINHARIALASGRHASDHDKMWPAIPVSRPVSSKSAGFGPAGFYQLDPERSMTKTELIDAIVAGVDGLTKTKAEQALNATLNSIVDAVAKGDSLSLIGFGTFSKGERSERVARNPRTGEEIKVDAAKTVKFKAGQKFKDAVNR
jgi:DNA-binding protein HU-beta